MVERATVNRLVVGSNPTAGANRKLLISSDLAFSETTILANCQQKCQQTPGSSHQSGKRRPLPSDYSLTARISVLLLCSPENKMTRRYRIFLRGNTYYAHDAETGKQTSLHTRDKRKAERLLLAKNEADDQEHDMPSWSLVGFSFRSGSPLRTRRNTLHRRRSRFAENEDRLGKATKAVAAHWQRKNAKTGKLAAA